MRIARLFVTVLGVILLLWTAIDYVPMVLQLAGTSVEGRVIDREVRFHGPRDQAESGVLTVRYEFQVDGVRHTGDASVPRLVYDSAESGKPLMIHYLAARPSINFPDGYIGQGVRGVPILLTGIACLIAVGILARRDMD